MLSTIEHLVLLDLLGSAQPRVMQWYKETGWLFNEMRGADVRLRESKVGAFGRTKGGNDAEWFSHLSFGGSIEDDQVPVSRNSGFLHLPSPHPCVSACMLVADMRCSIDWIFALASLSREVLMSCILFRIRSRRYGIRSTYVTHPLSVSLLHSKYPDRR